MTLQSYSGNFSTPFKPGQPHALYLEQHIRFPFHRTKPPRSPCGTAKTHTTLTNRRSNPIGYRQLKVPRRTRTPFRKRNRPRKPEPQCRPPFTCVCMCASACIRRCLQQASLTVYRFCLNVSTRCSQFGGCWSVCSPLLNCSGVDEIPPNLSAHSLSLSRFLINGWIR